MKVKAVIYLLAREGMGSKQYIIDFGISTSIEIDGDGAAECIRRLQQGACQFHTQVPILSR